MTDSQKPSLQTLDRVFAKGVIWTAGAKWGTQLITWASVVMVARLLSPAELGLVAMAGVFTVPFGMLAEFGLGAAVVQMRDLSEDVIQQLHSASFLICSLFYAAVWFISPWVAEFFGVPQLRWIIVASCLLIPMVGIQTVPLARLRRALDYRRLALLEAMELTVSAIITVSAAYLGASYWSPVIGIGSARALAVAVVMRVAPSPFRPPRWRSVREPLLFGWRVSISSFSQMAASQIDSLMVAKRLNESTLGSYRLAWDLASGPADKVSALLMRASGPLFAGLEKDLVLMRRYFLKIAEALSLSVFPLLAGLALVAPDAVLLLFGEKWQAAVAPLRFLALGRMAASLSVLCSQVLYSLHQPRFLMYVAIAKVTTLAIACYLAAPYGIGAVAAVWLVVFPCEHLVSLRKLLKMTSMAVGEYIGALLPAVAGCMFMAMVVLGIQQLPSVTSLPVAARLGLQVAAGAMAYFALLAIVWRPRLMAYLQFAKGFRRS